MLGRVESSEHHMTKAPVVGVGKHSEVVRFEHAQRHTRQWRACAQHMRDFGKYCGETKQDV
jgi:hypothetical protein